MADYRIAPGVRTLDEWVPSVLLALGLGMVWGWRNFAFPFVTQDVSFLSTVLPCLGALAALTGCAIWADRVEMARPTTVLIACGAVPATLQIVYAGVVAMGSGDSVFALTLQSLASAAGTVLLIAWGRASTRMRPYRLVFGVAGSLLIGAAFCALLFLVPMEASLALSSVLPLVSACLFIQASKLEAKSEAAVLDLSAVSNASRVAGGRLRGDRGLEHPTRMQVVAPILIVLLMGIEESLRAVFSASQLVPSDFMKLAVLAMVGGGLVSIPICVLIRRFRRFPAYGTVSRYLPLLIVASHLTILLLGDGNLSLAFLLIGAGYWCLRLYLWTTASCIVRNSGASATRVYALAELGVTVLTLFAQHLGDTASALSLSAHAYVVPCVFAVTCIFALLSSNRCIRAFEPADAEGLIDPAARTDLGLDRRASHEGSFSGAVSSGGVGPGDVAETSPDVLVFRRMAEEYGLTKRELEVVDLLSKGRSLPYISNEIGVALGTAQTHTRHIYEKVGVHNRQELIDFVEGLRRGSQRRQ